MKIDTHHHAVPPRIGSVLAGEPKYNMKISGDRWSGGPTNTEFQVSGSMSDPAAKLKELDATQLDVAVISAPMMICYYDLDPDAGERISRETNLGFEEFCSYDPKRLKWLAQLPLQAPERSQSVLEEAVAHGCSGVHAGTSIMGRRLDEPDFEPFWSAVESLDMTVFIHPMFAAALTTLRQPSLPAPGTKLPPWNVMTGLVAFPAELTLTAYRLILSGVLARHPKARVHLALGGGFFPYQLGRLRIFRAQGNYPELKDTPADPVGFVGQITIDTHVTDVKALRFLIDQMGAANVALGTDRPFNVSIPDPIGELRLATNSDESVVRQVAETTPARLFHVND